MKPTRFTSVARLRFLGSLLVVGAVLATGCETLSNSDVQESVEFTSTPSHASVTLNNTVVGQTPFSLILPKLTDTRVAIAKPGFAPAEVTIRAVSGGLTPNPVDVTLRTELLPEKPGADKQAGLDASMTILRKYIAAGTIAPEDAALAEAQIRAFYK